MSAAGQTVLVAGCGYVGAALAAELAAEGHRVLGLRRSAAALPPGVSLLQADLTEPSTLRELPDDVERVVYAVSPSGRSEQAYEDAYVRGLTNLLDALAARGAPVARVVLTSSTAVYGQDDGGWVDETSETAPSRFSGRVLLRAEQTLQEAPFEGVALRLSGIYGPGRTWLVRKVEAGEAKLDPPGATPRYGNRIHRDDCAGAIRHLLWAPEPPAVLLGVDDAPVPLGEVYRFVAGLLGAPAPEPGEGDEGRGGNKRCRNDRLKESGYALRVATYRQGYPPIVEEHLASQGA